MSDSNGPVKTPYNQKLDNFKRHIMPAVVWIGAVLICVTMLFQRATQYEFIGLAQSLDYEISAATTGTIETVVVQLFDHVEAGDVVAKFDDTEVLAAIQTAGARVSQLRAELNSARIDNDSSAADWSADLRRFQTDEEERRLDILSLTVEIETDQIRLERRSLDVRRSLPLVESGLISDTEFENLQLVYNQTRTQIDENNILLAQTEEEYKSARSRRLEFERSQPGFSDGQTLLQPLIAAIEVESLILKEIELQRSKLLLRSPVAGQISQLLCRKGQSVVPGEPILTVSEPSVTEIVAYLNETVEEPAKVNTRVRVASLKDPTKIAESIIVRVSPTVQALPERLWTVTGRPTYGRAMVIAGVPDLELTPGELLSVTILAR
jgi:multidrug resistance efflux pump